VIRTRRSLVAMSAILAIVLAACGSSSGSKSGGGGTSSTTKAAATPTSGNGTLVIGAEQEMDCADWIASCAGSSWGVWEMEEHTMPRVFEYEKDASGTWQNVPSILMAEMPTVTQVNGKQTVTYKINPQATWDDGTPVTADDFAFNWKSQNPKTCPDCETAGNGGYDIINAVTGSDNGKTVTVTFDKPYTDWKGIFNSAAPLYPAHLASQHGDLNTPAGVPAASMISVSTAQHALVVGAGTQITALPAARAGANSSAPMV